MKHLKRRLAWQRPGQQGSPSALKLLPLSHRADKTADNNNLTSGVSPGIVKIGFQKTVFWGRNFDDFNHGVQSFLRACRESQSCELPDGQKRAHLPYPLYVGMGSVTSRHYFP